MAKTLTLLIWPDYINPDTLAHFTERYGIKVMLEVVPSAVEMLERMRDPGSSPDLLCPPDYVVRELAAEGRLYSLVQDALPNLKHIMPRFRSGRPHDPESRVSVVKDWGTTGFMYRTDIVTGQPQSWADFWHLAQKYSRQVTVLDSPGEVIGAALKMGGHSYNSEEPDALAQAEEDLLALKPHLCAFETNYRPLLQAGDAVLALGWNGDAAALQAAGVPIRYVVPSEGSQSWEDDWAIAAGTQLCDEAHLFLNFVLQPEIALQEARYTGYATGHVAAFEMLDEATKSNPSIYPPAEVLAKLEAGMPLSQSAEELRNAIWKDIRG